MGKKMTAKGIEKRIQKTSHANTEIRLDAVKYLWETKDERAIPILLEFLNDRQQDFRMAALSSLTSCFKEVEMENVDWYEIETKVMEIMTHDRSANVRAAAWKCLLQIGGIRSAILHWNEKDDKSYLSTPYNLNQEDALNLIEWAISEKIYEGSDDCKFSIAIRMMLDSNTRLTETDRLSLLTQWFENNHPDIKLTAALLLGTQGDYRGEDHVLSELTLDTFSSNSFLYEKFFRNSKKRHDALKKVLDFMEQAKEDSWEQSRIFSFLVTLGEDFEPARKALLELISNPSYRESIIINLLAVSEDNPSAKWDLTPFRKELEKISPDTEINFFERGKALELLSHILDASEWLKLFLSLDDYNHHLQSAYIWNAINNLTPASIANEFLLGFINNKGSEYRSRAIASLILEDQPEIEDLLVSIIKDRKEDPKARREALNNLRLYLRRKKDHDEKMDKFFLSLIKQKPLASTCIKYLFDIKHPDAGKLLKGTFNKHPKWFINEDSESDIMETLEWLVESGNKETLNAIKKIRHSITIPEYKEDLRRCTELIKHRTMN